MWIQKKNKKRSKLPNIHVILVPREEGETEKIFEK